MRRRSLGNDKRGTTRCWSSFQGGKGLTRCHQEQEESEKWFQRHHDFDFDDDDDAAAVLFVLSRQLEVSPFATMVRMQNGTLLHDRGVDCEDGFDWEVGR